MVVWTKNAGVSSKVGIDGGDRAIVSKLIHQSYKKYKKDLSAKTSKYVFEQVCR